jgi:hypothetical protein
MPFDPQAQSVVKAAFSEFFRALGDEFKSAAKTSTSLLVGFVGVVDQFERIQDAVARARDDFNEFTHWQPPDLEAAWRTRVINPKKAYEQIGDLKNEILHDSVDQFRELIDAIKALRAGVDQALSPRQTSGGSEEEGGLLANIESSLVTIQILLTKAVDVIVDIANFTDTIADIKKRIESLEDFFLQQNNPRFRVGGLLLRDGKLHENENF